MVMVMVLVVMIDLYTQFVYCRDNHLFDRVVDNSEYIYGEYMFVTDSHVNRVLVFKNNVHIGSIVRMDDMHLEINNVLHNMINDCN